MTNNPFEKQIADKLNQYEVQPGEGLLDTIFEKRATRKKPYAGVARLFFAAAIISVTVSTFYMYDDQGNGTPIASNRENTVEGKQTEAPASASVSGDNVGKDKSVTDAVPEKKETPAIAGKSDKAAHSVPVAKNHAVKQEPAGSSRIASYVNHQEKAPGRNKHTIAVNNRFEGDNGADIARRYFDIDSKDRPRIASMKHKGNSHLYVYHSVSESVLDANTFAFLPIIPLKKFSASYEFENENKLAQRKVVMPTLARSSRKPLFIDMLYIPIITSTSASGNPGVEGFANSISRNSYNSQYGVRINVPVLNRINIFSGLFYQEQSNVFKGTIISKPEQVTTINTIVSYVNDPTGKVTKVTTYDTVNNVQSNETNYNYKNTYKLFQVPLGFSYNFGYKKFDFAVNASALVNMFSNSSGRTLDMEHNSTNGFSSSGKYVGLGAGFSLMSAYSISPRFKMIFEPGVQYFRINSMKAGNNINERVFNNQLTIGLRYSVF